MAGAGQGHAGQHLAHLARLAFEGVAENERHDAQAPGLGGRRFEHLAGAGDQSIVARRQPRIARLGCFQFARLQTLAQFGRNRDAVAVDDGQRLGGRRRVRHRWAGGNDCRIVARHVGNGQGQYRGPATPPRPSGRP